MCVGSVVGTVVGPTTNSACQPWDIINTIVSLVYPLFALEINVLNIVYSRGWIQMLDPNGIVFEAFSP